MLSISDAGLEVQDYMALKLGGGCDQCSASSVEVVGIGVQLLAQLCRLRSGLILLVQKLFINRFAR